MPDNDRTLHPSLESWLAEAARRQALGHRLIPADDPRPEGPWNAPTVGPKIGFHDLDDEEGGWNLVEIGQAKRALSKSVSEALTPEQKAAFDGLRRPI